MGDRQYRQTCRRLGGPRHSGGSGHAPGRRVQQRPGAGGRLCAQTRGAGGLHVAGGARGGRQSRGGLYRRAQLSPCPVHHDRRAGGETCVGREAHGCQRGRGRRDGSDVSGAGREAGGRVPHAASSGASRSAPPDWRGGPGYPHPGASADGGRAEGGPSCPSRCSGKRAPDSAVGGGSSPQGWVVPGR
jgi:hypothetical protein